MSTLTPRLGLYKPAADGSENINVVTDLNNNLDRADSTIGALPCTSGTRPASPYDGQFIRETDTGKMMVYNGTAAAWQQVLFHTASFANGIDTAGSVTSASFFRSTRGSATSGAFAGRVTGNVDDRVLIQADGKYLLGDGTNPPDTNLYRSAANTLKTDDNLAVALNLDVDGNADVGGALSLTGNLNLGAARVRTQLGATATLSNSTTETILAGPMNIPANDAVAGAMFRITAWGIASVTGTPTLQFRMRVGGLAGTSYSNMGAIPFVSAATNRLWNLEYFLHILTTGAGGTARYFGRMFHSFSTNTGLPHATVVPLLDASVSSSPTFNTTVGQDIVITGLWSAASASNTTTCYYAQMERVA